MMNIDASILKALASGTRRDILQALKAHHGIILSDLARALGKHVTTVKEHLQVLEKAGLVDKDKQPGRKFVFYSLSPVGARILLPYLNDVTVLFVIGFLVVAGGFEALYAPFGITFTGAPGIERTLVPEMAEEALARTPRGPLPEDAGGGGEAFGAGPPPEGRIMKAEPPSGEIADAGDDTGSLVDSAAAPAEDAVMGAARTDERPEAMAASSEGERADEPEIGAREMPAPAPAAEGAAKAMSADDAPVPALMEADAEAAPSGNGPSGAVSLLLVLGCLAMAQSLMVRRRRQIIFERLAEAGNEA